RCALRTPMTRAAKPTRSRYGNMMRVRYTVSSPAAGLAKNPGAMTRTIHGEATTPTRVMELRSSSMTPVTLRSMRSDSARDRVDTYPGTTGTNADERRPSATRRRRRFGSRNATKNASVATPAPKARATTRSRMKPKIRLAMVAELTTTAARATARAPDTGGAGGNSSSSVPIGRSALIEVGNLDSADRARYAPESRRRPACRASVSTRANLEWSEVNRYGQHQVRDEAEPAERE